MGIHAAVVPAAGSGQADDARLFDPLLRRDINTVKIGIVQFLPKTEKDNRILIPQPAVHDKARIFRIFILGTIRLFL